MLSGTPITNVVICSGSERLTVRDLIKVLAVAVGCTVPLWFGMVWAHCRGCVECLLMRRIGVCVILFWFSEVARCVGKGFARSALVVAVARILPSVKNLL